MKPRPPPARCVYIVDDDPSVRDSLSLLLSLRGHAAETFPSAEAFLNGLRPDWRGCVLADLRMPGMGGLELQRRLRALASRLPVVLITGHGDIDAARRAFGQAAIDLLEKPFDEDRLMGAVQRALARLDGELADSGA